MIEFVGVSKSFRHGGGPKLMRAYLRDLFFQRERRFYALRNVSFRLEDGESMAVVGGNGAGKSTLLSLVAGLSTPQEGSVEVRGRVAALLELGSGFHYDLTGIENIRLYASLLGMSRRRTEQVMDEIIAFADIGDFIGEAARTYSTGMLMRVAFAVAVNTDPDILIIDEVLAVGDQSFQNKCFDKIRELKAGGKTLLFVSHAMPIVRDLCTRALWLAQGRVMMDGPADEVLDAYTNCATPTALG